MNFLAKNAGDEGKIGISTNDKVSYVSKKFLIVCFSENMGN